MCGRECLGNHRAVGSCGVKAYSNTPDTTPADCHVMQTNDQVPFMQDEQQGYPAHDSMYHQQYQPNTVPQQQQTRIIYQPAPPNPQSQLQQQILYAVVAFVVLVLSAQMLLKVDMPWYIKPLVGLAIGWFIQNQFQQYCNGQASAPVQVMPPGYVPAPMAMQQGFSDQVVGGPNLTQRQNIPDQRSD